MASWRRSVALRGESVAVGGREDRRGGAGRGLSERAHVRRAKLRRESLERANLRALLSRARATTVANLPGCSNGAHRGEARLADSDAPGNNNALDPAPAPSSHDTMEQPP